MLLTAREIIDIAKFWNNCRLWSKSRIIVGSETINPYPLGSGQHYSPILVEKEKLKLVKKEIIKIIADKHNDFTQKEIEGIVDTFLDTVTSTLVSGEKVQLYGFGTFEVKERAAREGRNPKTGESIMISASKVPKFKPASALKNAVNE